MSVVLLILVLGLLGSILLGFLLKLKDVHLLLWNALFMPIHYVFYILLRKAASY